MIKAYISLPITGRTKEDYTKAAEDAEKRLRYLGYETVSPLRNGLPTEAPVCEHMKADYKMLLGCDAIYLCEGWEYSHGCMNELQMAADCRLVIISHTNSDAALFELKKEMERRR